MKKVIKVGTIEGRHDMPVDMFIINEVIDPMDFKKINHMINDRMKEIFEPFIVSKSGVAINASTWDESMVFEAPDIRVEVFVTGFTPVTIAIIQWMNRNGIDFVPMHWNRDTNTFVPQW